MIADRYCLVETAPIRNTVNCDGGEGRLGGDGEPGGAGVFEGGDVVDVAQGEADVVEAFHQAPAGVVVDLERRLDPGRLGQHDSVVQVYDDFGGRVRFDGVLQRDHRS